MQLINTLLLLNAMTFGGVETPDVTPTEPEVVEPTPEETPTISFEDKNGNDIPDAFEKYWDDNIRNRYFDIGLASVVAFGIAVAPTIYHVISRKKEKKENKTQINELVEENNKLVETIKTNKEDFDKEIEKRDREIEKLTNEIKISTKSLNESALALQNVADYETKINAILKCHKATTKDREYIKQGISREINEIIEKVEK